MSLRLSTKDVPRIVLMLAALAAVRPVRAQQPAVEITSDQLLFLDGVVMSETGTVVVLTVRGAIGDQRVVASRILPGSSHVDREIVLETIHGSTVTPSVAIARSGNNTFVFAAPECGEVAPGVKVRRFDFNLVAQGSAQTVQGVPSEYCWETMLDVASASDGRLAMAWTTPAASGTGVVFVRRMSPSGAAAGEVITASEEKAVSYSHPVVALDAAQDVTVAWERANDLRHVLLGRFTPTASSGAGSHTRAMASSAWSPAVATFQDGRSVIGWVAGSSEPRTFLQAFNPDGTPAGAEMSGTPASERAVVSPAIAVANDGRYLVAGLGKPGVTAHAIVDAFRFPAERMGNLMDRRTSGVAVEPPKVAIGQGGRSWVVAWTEMGASGVAIVIVRGQLQPH
jgi:hypothetical protein